MFHIVLLAAVLATPAPQPTAPMSIARAVSRTGNGALLYEGRQIHVVGTANVASGMYFRDVEKVFLQDSAAGLGVFTRTAPVKIVEGDVVDAVGRLNLYNGEPELLAAQLRVVRHGRPPEPIEVAPEDLLSRRYAGRLVRTEASVVATNALPRGVNIVLSAGSGTLIAHLTADQALLFPKEIARGATVRITGVASEYTREGRTTWELMPRGSTDVVLIERGPAISPRTAWIATAILVAIAAIVFAWIVSLRRKVRKALAEYRELDERYRFLFEDNPMPMWVCDAKSKRILTINRAAITKYGFTTDEFRAMSMGDFDASDGAGQRRSVGRQRTKNGRTVLVEVLSQPIVYAGHDALIFLAVDVTEWAAGAELASS